MYLVNTNCNAWVIVHMYLFIDFFSEPSPVYFFLFYLMHCWDLDVRINYWIWIYSWPCLVRSDLWMFFCLGPSQTNIWPALSFSGHTRSGVDLFMSSSLQTTDYKSGGEKERMVDRGERNKTVKFDEMTRINVRKICFVRKCSYANKGILWFITKKRSCRWNWDINE